jgi:hypothetical protein
MVKNAKATQWNRWSGGTSPRYIKMSVYMECWADLLPALKGKTFHYMIKLAYNKSHIAASRCI